MRSAARAHVAAHHDWVGNVGRYQAIYQALLEPGANLRKRAAA
jgi:hypothetical protein